MVAGDSLGNVDLNELGFAETGGIDNLDLKLFVGDRLDGQAFARRHFAMAFGKQGAILVVDVVAAPVIPRHPQRAASIDHLIDELLGDRGVALTGDRWLGAVNLLEVGTAGSGDLGRPAIATTVDLNQAAPFQGRRRNAVEVVFHHPVGAAVTDPAQDCDLRFRQGLALRHRALHSSLSGLRNRSLSHP